MRAMPLDRASAAATMSAGLAVMSSPCRNGRRQLVAVCERGDEGGGGRFRANRADFFEGMFGRNATYRRVPN